MIARRLFRISRRRSVFVCGLWIVGDVLVSFTDRGSWSIVGIEFSVTSLYSLQVFTQLIVVSV